MKVNLKTLKKCIDTANEPGCVTTWIVGFEKELREILRKNTLPVGYGEFITKEEEKRIKEILGE